MVKHVPFCSTAGQMFRAAAGDQPFNLSAVSSAFPMVNHAAFGLHTTSSGRSEFGGLGTIGASSALVGHTQLSFPGDSKLLVYFKITLHNWTIYYFG